MIKLRLFLIITTTALICGSIDLRAGTSQKVAPVLDLKSLDTGCLMGASANGRWISAEEAARSIRGGEKYNIYSLTSKIGEAAGSKPESVGAPCEETQSIALSPAPGESATIAVAGSWNAIPREIKSLSTNSQVYRDAVAEILKKNGIANPKVNLTQVIRCDLEGDGVEEVVLSASRFAAGSVTPDAKAEDYSLVVVRKLIAGKVETITISAAYHVKSETFSAPSEYVVSAIADLNGDGRMEIALHGRYYEGAWTTIYTIEGGKAKEALTCGCGA